ACDGLEIVERVWGVGGGEDEEFGAEASGEVEVGVVDDAPGGGQSAEHGEVVEVAEAEGEIEAVPAVEHGFGVIEGAVQADVEAVFAGAQDVVGELEFK